MILDSIPFFAKQYSYKNMQSLSLVQCIRYLEFNHHLCLSHSLFVNAR